MSEKQEENNNNIKIDKTSDYYLIFTLENIRISNFDKNKPIIRTKITNFTKLQRDSSFFD